MFLCTVSRVLCFTHVDSKWTINSFKSWSVIQYYAIVPLWITALHVSMLKESLSNLGDTFTADSPPEYAAKLPSQHWVLDNYLSGCFSYLCTSFKHWNLLPFGNPTMTDHWFYIQIYIFVFTNTSHIFPRLNIQSVPQPHNNGPWTYNTWMDQGPQKWS